MGAVLLALVATPWSAGAQTYTMRMEPVDYQVMPPGGFPGGEPAKELTTSSWGVSAAAHRVELPFPVTFYGQTYNEMWVYAAGLVIFGDDRPSTFTTSTTSPPWRNPTWKIDDPPGGENPVPPPNNSIIMWGWNLVCANTTSTGRVQVQTLGTAPRRKFVLDYPNCRAFNLSTTTSYQFQLWLSEDSDDIEIRYGHDINSSSGPPPPGNNNYPLAIIGIRKDHLDYTAGPCYPNCEHADFPSGNALIFSAGPQIRVEDIQGPTDAYAGIGFPVQFDLRNPGSHAAENFTLRYWVSPEPQITVDALSAGLDDRRWTLNPRDAVRVFAEPRLPIELEEGEYYLIVEADPEFMVPISNRASTLGVYGPFRVGIRAANLTVPWVEAPDLVKPGEVLNLRWLARNAGNLLANAIEYRVILERDRFYSPATTVLSGGTISELGPSEELFMETSVRIPGEVEPGVYYLGVAINPNRDVYEHEFRDNVGFSLPVVVAEDELVVLTRSLPQAHIHGHYEVRLVAVGGDGRPHWEVRPGTALPPGLRLEVREAENGETATFLVGQPGAVGTFPLAFVVTSGSISVDVDLELDVSAAEFELTIATDSLAEASFGFQYRHELSAMGGTPPYTWEALGEKPLPHGMFLRSDGVLSGRPQEDGQFQFLVRVTDDQGRQTTKTLVLNVSPPAALTCVTQELPQLAVGEFFQTQLLAAGGKKRADGTYVWTHQSLLRLAEEMGEVSTPVNDDLGLTLEHNGVIHGEPKMFGTFLWTLRVTDDTPGAPGILCPVLVRIPHDRGLTVVTQQLPVAIAGRSFRAQLEAIGGEGDIKWSEYGSRSVLEEVLKLRFDATGSLVGTPPADVLQGEEEREFSITVRAQDARGRIGIGVVNLVVKAAPERAARAEDDEGGCQTAGGGPVGGLILLAGLALLRRRRS